MDPTLEGSYSWEEGIRIIKIGLLCTHAVATLRPSMSQVLLMLTGEQHHIPSPTMSAFVYQETVIQDLPSSYSRESQDLNTMSTTITPDLPYS